jgi:transcriptional regulator with XRE-family HTH domain
MVESRKFSPLAVGVPMNDTSYFYTAVGRLVREARDKAGLTQEALASRVGLTRTSVTNIEKGRQKLLLHTFCDLAGALGVLPDALLPESRESPAEPEIEDLLKGRPKKEQEWIKSAIVSARKGS